MTIWSDGKSPYQICQELWSMLTVKLGKPERDPSEKGRWVHNIEPDRMCASFRTTDDGEHFFSFVSLKPELDIAVIANSRICIGEEMRDVREATGRRKLKAFIKLAEASLKSKK